MVLQNQDVLQGTLALLILKTLGARPRLHGYAITAHIHRISDDLLRVQDGSLYPALHRMEQAGLLKAEWGLTDKNRRTRLYSLTARGRTQLTEEQDKWDRVTTGVAKVLQYSDR